MQIAEMWRVVDLAVPREAKLFHVKPNSAPSSRSSTWGPMETGGSRMDGHACVRADSEHLFTHCDAWRVYVDGLCPLWAHKCVRCCVGINPPLVTLVWHLLYERYASVRFCHPGFT